MDKKNIQCHGVHHDIVITGDNEIHILCSISYKSVCVPSEDSDQSEQAHSLIRIFTGHCVGSQ